MIVPPPAVPAKAASVTATKLLVGVADHVMLYDVGVPVVAVYAKVVVCALGFGQIAVAEAAQVVDGAGFTVKVSVPVAVPDGEVKVTTPVVPAPIVIVAVVAVVAVTVAAVPPIVAEATFDKLVPVTTNDEP